MDNETKTTEQEQVIETTTQSEVEESKVETTQEATKPYKVFNTEEEYNKHIQSEHGKAKGNFLKNKLGAENVDDYLKSQQAKDNELKSLKEKLDTLDAEHKQLKEDSVLKGLGLNMDKKKDFLTLVNAKVNDETDFNKACEDVMKDYPLFKQNAKAVKIGTEQKQPNSKEIEDKKIMDDVNKFYVR